MMINPRTTLHSKPLPPIFQQIRDLRIQPLVHAHIKANPDNPLVRIITHLLNEIQAKSSLDLVQLVKQLLSTLASPQFYAYLYEAISNHIRAHPWETAFFIIGVILMCNPLGMIGFGPMGPIAGSLAAQWQSTMHGFVAAGSAFAILQSWGMTYGVVIPAIGSGIAGAAVAVAVTKEQLAKELQKAQGMINDFGGKVEAEWKKHDPVGHAHEAASRIYADWFAH